MGVEKQMHYYTLAPASTSFVFTDLAINDDGQSYEAPESVTIDNDTGQDLYIKLMDKNEGEASSRLGVKVANNQTKTFEVEKDELPFYKIGARRVSGSGALSLIVSAQKFVYQRSS